MAKNEKKPTTQLAKSTPEIYQGLNCDIKFLKLCLQEDVHGGFYLFETPSHSHIIKTSIQKSWANENEFDHENKNTILAYHENLFKANPPADQDLIITALHCWYKMCSIAVDRTPKTPVTDSGRKSSVLNSTYRLGDVVEGTVGLKTPQAIACTNLFRACIQIKQDADTTLAESKSQALPADYVPTVTEDVLKKYIEENATVLKTKQAPWRIFQYYRANLIAAKILKRN